MALISISITGCWNNADADPHPLPPLSSDAGSPDQICYFNDVSATPLQTTRYCTRTLRIDASAQSFGQGTDVYVAMFSALDLENFLALGEGDSLQASTTTESHDLVLESAFDGTIHYTAHFESDDPGLVTIAFTRHSDQPGGLARVQVAPSFEISGAPASFHYGDAIDFSVSPVPSGNVIGAYIDGPCAVSQHAVGDETTVPVSSSGGVALATSNMFLATGECNVTTHVRVDTVGTIDPVFDSTSTVSGLQERGFQSALEL